MPDGHGRAQSLPLSQPLGPQQSSMNTHPGFELILQPLGGEHRGGLGAWLGEDSRRKHKSDSQPVWEHVEVLGKRLVFCASQESVIFIF